jgi:DNA-binding response OmpR family regulator
MMVDDEDLVIELTQMFLQEAGYNRFVHTTESPEAIALMQRERPHVVLLDVNMPTTSGFEILERMRADPALSHVAAVMLTAADDPAMKRKALELGASDVLRKPLDESELLLRVRNVLAARAYRELVSRRSGGA